ncbi:transcriptional regulator [Candidatus Woesearchaeota archaeon]|mgnify:CR=1 FL=1|nr:MAG: transcriptional regulator [Candidatus Woesearchaeota archaeon]
MFVVEKLKALADETRLKIIKELLKKERNVTQLVEKVKKSQPNVSLALNKLENAKIISKKKNGKNIIYSLKNKENIKKILELVKDE